MVCKVLAPGAPFRPCACPGLPAVRDSSLSYPDFNLNNLDSCCRPGGTLNGRK